MLWYAGTQQDSIWHSSPTWTRSPSWTRTLVTQQGQNYNYTVKLPQVCKPRLQVSRSHMSPGQAKNHVQTGFLQVAQCILYCLHGLHPIRDHQVVLQVPGCTRPPRTLTRPTRLTQGFSRLTPTSLHAPLGARQGWRGGWLEIPKKQGFLPYLLGSGYGGQGGRFWVSKSSPFGEVLLQQTSQQGPATWEHIRVS